MNYFKEFRLFLEDGTVVEHKYIRKMTARQLARDVRKQAKLEKDPVGFELIPWDDDYSNIIFGFIESLDGPRWFAEVKDE